MKVEKVSNEAHKWWKKNKAKEFKLNPEDKKLLDAKMEDLKEIVKKELEGKIYLLADKLTKFALDKSEVEADKNAKKNAVLKLKRFRKELNDETAIKKRVDMLKIKKRKLKSLFGKIQERLDKLKLSKVRCFKCRRRGHSIAECTYTDVVEGDDAEDVEESKVEEGKAGEESTAKTKSKKGANKAIVKPSAEDNKVLCYNCGSNEHNIHGCKLKVDYSNLPFAECFICKKKGHISSNCPTNENGIYIRGGACFVCNKKDHLAKNCPEKQLQVENEKQERVAIKKSQAEANVIANESNSTRGSSRGRGGFSRGRGGFSRGGSRGGSRGESRGFSRGGSRGGSRGESRGFSRGGSRGFSRGGSRGFSRGGSRGESRGFSRGGSRGGFLNRKRGRSDN